MTSPSADTPDSSDTPDSNEISAQANQPDQPDPFVQRFLEQCERQEKARIATVTARLKKTIIPRLKKWGVSKIHAEYSGYGDSGAINHITYLDAQDQPVNMSLVRAASDPDIERVLYEFLPEGFAESEGGQGDITIDIAAGTVKIEHQENVTETRDSLMEYTL
jgi:hypothetical protein